MTGGESGPDGKPRALHIDQALESIDFERGPVEPITPRIDAASRRGHARAPIALSLFRSGTAEPQAVRRRSDDPTGSRS